MATPSEFLVLLSHPDNDEEQLVGLLAEDLQFIHAATHMPGTHEWVVRQDDINLAYLRGIAEAAQERGLTVRFGLREGADGDWVERARSVIDHMNEELDGA